MKTVIRIIQALLVIMVLVSLLSLFYECNLAERTYRFSQEDYLDGSYKKKFKTLEDLNENRINSYMYTYMTYKQKLKLDFSIVGLLLLLLLLKRRDRNPQMPHESH